MRAIKQHIRITCSGSECLLSLWFVPFVWWGVKAQSRPSLRPCPSKLLVWINAWDKSLMEHQEHIGQPSRPNGSPVSFIFYSNKLISLLCWNDSFWLCLSLRFSSQKFHIMNLTQKGNETLNFSYVSNMYFRSIHRNFHNPSTTSQYRIYPSKVCWVNWIWRVYSKFVLFL